MADLDGAVYDAIADYASTSKGNNRAAAVYELPRGLATDVSPPVITNFDPPVGTPIQRADPVTFEVTDLNLLRAEIFVSIAGDVFVVHDGVKFRGNFTQSSRSPIPNGFRFVVRRAGGWYAAPTFEVHAVDTGGNEA
jgi:hypothetical protein